MSFQKYEHGMRVSLIPPMQQYEHSITESTHIRHGNLRFEIVAAQMTGLNTRGLDNLLCRLARSASRGPVCAICTDTLGRSVQGLWCLTRTIMTFAAECMQVPHARFLKVQQVLLDRWQRGGRAVCPQESRHEPYEPDTA